MIKSKTNFNSIYNYIYIFLLVVLIIIVACIPELSIKTFGQGVLMWATKILPALLPFFILTKLLSYTTFTSTIGNFLTPITQKLFGVGGTSGYIYIMSILSGYPVGAKLTSDLYQNKQLTTNQAITISSFTSTSGPLFIIGTVGIGFFGNFKLGLIVLISHLVSALINGLLYRCKEQTKSKENKITISNTNNILNESMISSINSIMVVGGFIALFYMILNLLNHLNIFSPIIWILSKIGISKDISFSIISGLIEVTTGTNYLSKLNLGFKFNTILTSFLISFGGFSIHAQAYCFLKNFNMKYSKFLLQKITHAIISASVTFIILLF